MWKRSIFFFFFRDKNDPHLIFFIFSLENESVFIVFFGDWITGIFLRTPFSYYFFAIATLLPFYGMNFNTHQQLLDDKLPFFSVVAKKDLLYDFFFLFMIALTICVIQVRKNSGNSLLSFPGNSTSSNYLKDSKELRQNLIEKCTSLDHSSTLLIGQHKLSLICD